MALYRYQALNRMGKRVSDTIDATSTAHVRQQLGTMGLYPITITSATTETSLGFNWRSLFERPVSIKEKIFFTKQLAVLLKSGVPLVQALELLSEQFDGKLKTIIISIRDGIKEGDSFAKGLAQFPQTFDKIYIQLVRAGEASGKLEVILDRLTVFLERRDEVQKKVKGALRYPLIQLTVISLVVVFLMTFVVPQLAENFAEQGAALPWTTQVVVGISSFLTHHYLMLLIILAIVIVLFKYWSSSPSGSLTIDQIKLKLPLIRFFTRTNTVVQFCQTLGMLTESGVNLSESLDIVVNIIDNQVLAASLKEARDQIIKQGKIASFLQKTNIFPPIAIYLIRTGEESGQLGFMLLTVGDNYEKELEELTDGLSAQIQPIMLIVMAVVVGFIIISVIQPIINIQELATI